MGSVFGSEDVNCRCSCAALIRAACELSESLVSQFVFLGSALIEGEVFERPGRPRGPRGPCSAVAVAPLLLGFASSLLHSPTVVANVALTNDQRDVQDIRNNLLSFTRVLTVRESEQLLFLHFSVRRGLKTARCGSPAVSAFFSRIVGTTAIRPGSIG